MDEKNVFLITGDEEYIIYKGCVYKNTHEGMKIDGGGGEQITIGKFQFKGDSNGSIIE